MTLYCEKKSSSTHCQVFPLYGGHLCLLVFFLVFGFGTCQNLVSILFFKTDLAVLFQSLSYTKDSTIKLLHKANVIKCLDNGGVLQHGIENVFNEIFIFIVLKFLAHSSPREF